MTQGTAQGQPILLASEVIAVEFPPGIGQPGHLAGYALADGSRRWTAPIPTDPVGWTVTPNLVVVQAADPSCSSAS